MPYPPIADHTPLYQGMADAGRSIKGFMDQRKAEEERKKRLEEQQKREMQLAESMYGKPLTQAMQQVIKTGGSATQAIGTQRTFDERAKAEAAKLQKAEEEKQQAAFGMKLLSDDYGGIGQPGVQGPASPEHIEAGKRFAALPAASQQKLIGDIEDEKWKRQYAAQSGMPPDLAELWIAGKYTLKQVEDKMKPPKEKEDLVKGIADRRGVYERQKLLDWEKSLDKPAEGAYGTMTARDMMRGQAIDEWDTVASRDPENKKSKEAWVKDRVDDMIKEKRRMREQEIKVEADQTFPPGMSREALEQMETQKQVEASLQEQIQQTNAQLEEAREMIAEARRYLDALRSAGK